MSCRRCGDSVQITQNRTAAPRTSLDRPRRRPPRARPRWRPTATSRRSGPSAPGSCPTGSTSTSTRKWSRRKVRPVTTPAVAGRRRRAAGPRGGRRPGRGRAPRVTFHPRNRATNAVGRVGARPSAGLPDCSMRPVVHHDDPVGERERLVVVVGHEQDREAEADEERAQLGDEPLAERAVERAERLVEHEQARRGRERAGERDALLLAARELGDPAVLEAGESDERERRRARARRLRRADAAASAARTRTLPEHVAVREQRVVLEHEPEPAPVRAARRRGRRRPTAPARSRRARARRPRAGACSCRSRSGRARTRSRRRRPSRSTRVDAR